MRATRWIPAAALAAAVAACAQTAGAPPATGAVEAAFAGRAGLIAAQWKAADIDAWNTGFVPVVDLTIWPATPDGATKMAVANGWYTLDTALPETSGSGSVVFADGRKIDVAVLSAKAAYDEIAVGGKPTCATTDDCVSLTVLGAKATTAQLQTSRGTATVPAWAFTVRQLQEPVVRVAVTPSEVSAPPQMSLPERRPEPPLPIAAALGMISATGDRIEYTVGVGSCDRDIRPLVWESDLVVVIGGTYTPPDGGACDMMLVGKQVAVVLQRPLGDRVVVDIESGRPVPPAVAPS